jgi:hypothetical protein
VGEKRAGNGGQPQGPRGRPLPLLPPPQNWRRRLRTTNLGECFFRHFRTFLRRFLGWQNENDAEQILSAYLLSQEQQSRFGMITPYQLQLNFNRGI